jgi:hypothetical protein
LFYGGLLAQFTKEVPAKSDAKALGMPKVQAKAKAKNTLNPYQPHVALD